MIQRVIIHVLVLHCLDWKQKQTHLCKIMILSNKHVCFCFTSLMSRVSLKSFVVSHFFQNYDNYCNQPHLVCDYWVGHCIVNGATRLEKMNEEEKKRIDITLDLHQKSSQIPDGLTNESKHRCTIELLHRTLPQRSISRLGFSGAILPFFAFLYFLHMARNLEPACALMASDVKNIALKPLV